MPRAKKSTLPKPGDVFAVKLRPGLWTVCRALRLPNGNEKRGWLGAGSVLVACSAWTGSTKPTMETLGITPILRLTHQQHKDEACSLWLDEPPPRKFVLIGSIAPTKADLKVKSNNLGQWAYLSEQALLQWQWDNDRDSVLAESAAADRRERDGAVEKQRAKRKKWKQLTIEDLRGYRFLSGWTKLASPSPAMRAASRRILREAVADLASLNPKPSRKDKRTALQTCIEKFNRLNREHGFIETSERDDILEEFKMLAHVCGLGKEEDMADAWRTW